MSAARPEPIAVFIGFDAAGHIVAGSTMYEGDCWPESRHRSFCRQGGQTVRTRKVSLEEAERIFREDAGPMRSDYGLGCIRMRSIRKAAKAAAS